MESLLFLPLPVSSTPQNSQLILHNITSNAESDKDVHLEYADDTVPISRTQSKHSAASYTSFNICSFLTGSFCISSGTFSPHLCAFPLAFSLPPLPPPFRMLKIQMFTILLYVQIPRPLFPRKPAPQKSGKPTPLKGESTKTGREHKLEPLWEEKISWEGKSWWESKTHRKGGCQSQKAKIGTQFRIWKNHLAKSMLEVNLANWPGRGQIFLKSDSLPCLHWGLTCRRATSSQWHPLFAPWRNQALAGEVPCHSRHSLERNVMGQCSKWISRVGFRYVVNVAAAHLNTVYSKGQIL